MGLSEFLTINGSQVKDGVFFVLVTPQNTEHKAVIRDNVLYLVEEDKEIKQILGEELLKISKVKSIYPESLINFLRLLPSNIKRNGLISKELILNRIYQINIFTDETSMHFDEKFFDVDFSQINEIGMEISDIIGFANIYDNEDLANNTSWIVRHTEQQSKPTTPKNTKDFKVMVSGYGNYDYLERFGNIGSIHEVANYILVDYCGYQWNAWKDCSPGNNNIEKLNDFFEGDVIFELVEEQQPKPTTPKNPKNFKIRVTECIGGSYYPSLGSPGSIHDVINGELIDYDGRRRLTSLNALSSTNYLEAINNHFYFDENNHAIFELIE